ncbi:beta-ketoacyl-ACP synthase III [Synechococcus elongatus]|uniref:Beta-ketoacyl-[acyl-carrier-protein] synthase III n=2 Tax=Synechococcus elongatus TaxID=32046 RepID=FABH_SYNE7|nr:beta-ketoacyl-ACP synthase III [Synechococcus elongatus]Q31N84.1 RecName: Full=Beta-ketoacyl-[acyl-carrier-protein] synthase III; Short=Beta-ketoacyl-ACP synthase III; Short=KAS III; AltName: Full=3-oxoacyl-[acyl-carrier-protein] synthase 3; AltName: Full=3-oxoacyl-[acyl-carrier-protein] synthase III [Synechococcus elongatus PCC 7942 = FACHB-805]Q5N5X5.1 RecName: Full=Beta-ketoacyl-[acyl-carrier-protein] synthase III; Short=Beta-ketoacyl-ACP synthase III; Short=KAS III; AltName: Full=3-oxoacyl
MTRPGVGVAITGSGSAVPSTTLSNDQLSQLVETSDEWIRSRTGIGQRRVAQPQIESLSSLAAAAGQSALEAAGLEATSVDLILLATSTPDDLFGSACQVQAALGATQAVAFDLTAACSGFLFALVTGAQFIRSGAYRTVLVIGADVLSRWTDWSDRRTCVLFGDGAGAVVLQASEIDQLLGFEMRSDGSLNGCLTLAYQADNQSLLSDIEIAQGTYQPVAMNGQEVYRFAVKRVPEILEKTLFHAGIDRQEVDWLLLHQANQRILDAVADRLDISRDRVLSNLVNYGNTSSATIPLVLDEAVKAGKIQSGDLIAASGFGAGLSWGAALFRWGTVV